MSEPTREELIAYAREAAIRNGIDPDIFVKQISQESGFQLGLTSSAGAKGIAQIVPVWHPGVNVDDPWESLDYAAALMASHFARYKNYSSALAAYNAGQGNVDKYGGVPPFEETQRYVNNILGSSSVNEIPTQSPPQVVRKNRYEGLFEKILPLTTTSMVPVKNYLNSDFRNLVPPKNYLSLLSSPLDFRSYKFHSNLPSFPSIKDIFNL